MVVARELVATREESNETKLLEHTYAIHNVGAAPARNVEVRFYSRGENITDEHYGEHDVVRIPAIAPRHMLPIASVTYSFGEMAADTVEVTWTDRRRKRQELQTSLLPLPTTED